MVLETNDFSEKTDMEAVEKSGTSTKNRKTNSTFRDEDRESEDTRNETGTETTETSETTGTTDYSEQESPSEMTMPDPIYTNKVKKVQHPKDILNIVGRQIRSEDFDWARPPIPSLAKLAIESTDRIKDAHVELFLKTATSEQKRRIFEKLPLDVALKITLSAVEDNTYWTKMCLISFPSWRIWRFSDNWKSMFVHLTVQEMIENFSPDESNFDEFIETLKLFSNFTTSLKITKLLKMKEKKIVINLSEENFDEKLDDIISSPPANNYFNFEKVFSCLPNLKDLTLMLCPNYQDTESFHLKVSDFNAFFKGLKKLNLQKLRISNATATNEQIIIMLKLHLTSETLTELDLSYNFIDDEVCDYVGKLLLSSCPLEKLILKNNKITNDGLRSIAAALSKNVKLKIFDVSLNFIENDGGSFLAEVLITNSTIVDLDVSKNKFKADAGMAFAKLIETSKTLRSLKIQANSFGIEIGESIKRAIRENFYLLELDIRFCGFTDEDEGNIYEYINRNRKNTEYSSYVANNNFAASQFLL